jgi:Protein of unknown function (DUF3040)
MSLSARDRHVLHSIEGELAESDPDLAAKLVKLSLLMADEDKPTAGGRQAGPRQAVVSSLARRLPGSRRRVHARKHSTWASALMAVWLATACALIVTAAVLSHVPAKAPCSALAVACGSQSPASHAQHGSGLSGQHSAASA